MRKLASLCLLLVGCNVIDRAADKVLPHKPEVCTVEHYVLDMDRPELSHTLVDTVDCDTGKACSRVLDNGAWVEVCPDPQPPSPPMGVR